MNIAQLFAFFTLKNKYVSYLCGGLLHFCVHNTQYIGQKAVINKPVVDMSSSFPFVQKLPASGQETLCRRANQGLYHELVDCMTVVGDMVKVDFRKVLYGSDAEGNFYSTFWLSADDLTLLKDINPLLLPMIPCIDNQAQLKLCLITPWNEFSVGTYFVRACDKDSELYYAIYVPNTTENTFTIQYVSKERALCVHQRSEKEMRMLFVHILHSLIYQAARMFDGGVVPYVWGGCSFVVPNIKDDFFYAEGAWHRPCHGSVYKGYDCSGLVWRAAQCAGIAFPWKVTKMMKTYCRPVDDESLLENGDIIWFEGHVMIVADIEKNMVIESAGYSNGYGCVHAALLSTRFGGIQTYDDLMSAYVYNIPIALLNAQGEAIKKVQVTLLKLMPPYLV